jgi:hypothetical protein
MVLKESHCTVGIVSRTLHGVMKAIYRSFSSCAVTTLDSEQQRRKESHCHDFTLYLLRIKRLDKSWASVTKQKERPPPLTSSQTLSALEASRKPPGPTWYTPQKPLEMTSKRKSLRALANV